MISALITALTLVTVTRGSSGPRFVDTASDHINIGYKTSVRMGSLVTDYTKLEISVQVSGALEDGGLGVGGGQGGVSVEVRSGEQGWVVVDTRPSIRGGVWSWSVSGVSPCVEHRLRVWVQDRDGAQASFEYPGHLSRVNVEDMMRSGYRPETPEHLIVDTWSEDGEVTVTWSRVECAEMYDVSWTSVTRDTTWSSQVTSPMVQLEQVTTSHRYDNSDE